MKNHKLLREAIRLILEESGSNTKLGMFVIGKGSPLTAVAYDVNLPIDWLYKHIAGSLYKPGHIPTQEEYTDALVEFLDSNAGTSNITQIGGGWDDVLYDSIKAMITIRKATNPCHGAFEVKYAAGPNQGQIVYGMGYYLSRKNGGEGLLIPDRSWVSQDARDGWTKVKAKKDKGLPLDDASNPKTPDPNDDCFVHTAKSLELGDGNDEVLDTVNRAYTVPDDDSKYENMIAVSDNFIKEFLLPAGVKINELRSDMSRNSMSFFRENFQP